MRPPGRNQPRADHPVAAVSLSGSAYLANTAKYQTGTRTIAQHQSRAAIEFRIPHRILAPSDMPQLTVFRADARHELRYTRRNSLTMV